MTQGCLPREAYFARHGEIPTVGATGRIAQR